MKKYSKIIGLVVFALFFYFFGYLVGHKNLIFEQNYKPKIVNKELMKPRSVDFGNFWLAWNKIEEKFAGSPDYQKMINGAIKGMVAALGDPYSVFMESQETKDFLEDLSGEISGIGAELDIKDGKLIIVAPLAESPAERAGLKPNDHILEIDGNKTDNISIADAVKKIRGKAGTKVTLKISRSGIIKDYSIQRAVIKIDSVRWEMKEGNVAYVEISQFGDDTSKLIQKISSEIKGKNPKAVILDLRNNPGGYLEASVDVASVFMKEGVVVKEQDKDGKIEEEKTTLEGVLSDYKVILLVNKGSASASEIVAGALQDAGRATIVGETTFGKGSVQNLEDLKEGATLRLTVAKWLTPKGRAINGVGIKPDVEVGLSEADYEQGKDPQLDKAIELSRQ